MTLNGDSATGCGSGSKMDSVGGKLVLEHVYELVRRIGTESLFTTFEAIAQPFGRTVWIRYYTEFEGLGFSQETETRIREVITSGGEGTPAVDHGELDKGGVFLVMPPPPERSIRDWSIKNGKNSAALAVFGVELVELMEDLGPSMRSAMALDRLHLEPRDDGTSGTVLYGIVLYGIGARPTRAEVRRMTGMCHRDLVMTFPPECFVPANADEDGIENTEAADVYRVSAVLYECSTGKHPVFPAEQGVTESVAELVSEVGQRPGPVRSGSWRLNTAITCGLALDPASRPSWDEFKATIRAAAEAIPTELAVDGSEAENSARVKPSWRPAWLGRVFRWSVFAMLLGAVSLGTYLATNQPSQTSAVLITSEPSGVQFEHLRGDGGVVTLGRTPIMLDQQPLNEPISLRPVYEDGRVGAIQTLTPHQLEIYDACRSIHIRFEPEQP